MALCIHGMAFDTLAALDRNQAKAACQEPATKLSAVGQCKGLVLRFISDLQLRSKLL